MSCPSCDAAVEADCHWITCPSRLDWRTWRLGSLKTHPGMKLIFLRIFKFRISSGECDFSDPSTFSADEQYVITCQSAIGWRRILFGSLSSECIRVQVESVDTKELKPTKFSEKKGHTAQKAIFAAKGLHGDTPRKTRSRYVPASKRQYELDIVVDRPVFFRNPLDDRLDTPLSVLTIWLSKNQTSFRQSLPAAQVNPMDDSFRQEQIEADFDGRL
jgi:hypothetical protein